MPSVSVRLGQEYPLSRILTGHKVVSEALGLLYGELGSLLTVPKQVQNEFLPIIADCHDDSLLTRSPGLVSIPYMIQNVCLHVCCKRFYGCHFNIAAAWS